MAVFDSVMYDPVVSHFMERSAFGNKPIKGRSVPATAEFPSHESKIDRLL